MTYGIGKGKRLYSQAVYSQNDSSSAKKTRTVRKKADSKPKMSSSMLARAVRREIYKQSETKHVNIIGDEVSLSTIASGTGLPLISQPYPAVGPDRDWETTHVNNFSILLKLDFYDRPIPGYFVDHQVSHASSVYYTSPFKESMIFTADASMNMHWACSGYFWGVENKLNIFRNPGYTYGNYYDVATEYCGIGPGTTKAGTLMGLSSFGTVSQKARDNWEWWTRPFDERSGTEDMHYCDWLFLQMSGRYPIVQWLRPSIVTGKPFSAIRL